MYKFVFKSLFIISSLFCLTTQAQKRDSLFVPTDTMPFSARKISDSIHSDSIHKDSLAVKKPKKKKAGIDMPVKYSAKDSMKFNMVDKKVYLWGEAQILYQNIDLKADYIIFDMATNIVYASGWPGDSTGEIKGKPIFKQGSEVFNSEELTFNFKTKKGYITNIKTDQNGGYLHSEITKRNPNGEVNLKHGKYTTCDNDHPHFYMALTKAKMIPDDKIVSGPAYMVIGDVPLPIGVPFGFFPNTKGAKSGVLIPNYGEDKIRGFKLQDGGYYWHVNDYLDLTTRGDIYTRRSWGLNVSSMYKIRYSFTGKTMFRYTLDKLNDSTKLNNYAIQWTHTQDPKANPYSTFSANVNMSSSSYDKLNSYTMSERLQSTKTSSIMYTRRGIKAPINFSVGLRQSQNSSTKLVTLDLPSFSFNTSTFYPFRKKNATGKMKWYENIQTNYTSTLENTAIVKDSNMFTRHMFDSLNNGFKHSVPLSTNFKISTFLTITPSLNYSGVAYTSYIEKRYNSNAIDTLTNNHIETINHKGMNYLQGIAPSIGLTLNPKVYGMYQVKNSKVKAIRHVMSPTAGFSYTPDVRKLFNSAGINYPNYYETIIDSSKRNPDGTYKTITYSPYEKGRYGVPVANGQSGGITLGIRNTLEMKVLSKNDTGVAVKKIPILENFDFSTGYNPFALPGTRKWSNINLNAGTRLFDGKYNIRMTGIFNPYQYVRHERIKLGSNTPTTKSNFYYADTTLFMLEQPNEFSNQSSKIARLTSLTFSLGTSFKSAQKKTTKAKTDEADKDKPLPNQVNPATGLPYSGYVDFNVPWSLNINLDLNYSKPYEDVIFNKTLRFSGDFNLTKNWKFGFNSGYDIKNEKMTATNISINRDLHCWIMTFTCVPFGPYQNYVFTIRVKAQMLQDLKYDKRQSWYDVL